MKRTILKKKESGTEGRKKRKQETKEAEKLKKFFVPFFKRCSSANTADNPISKVQSDQSEQEPEKFDQSKEDSKKIGQSEKTIEKVLNVKEEPESDVPDFISKHDVRLMNFDKNTKKPILSNRMRAKITKLGSKYRAMSSNCFKRKLANGEEVTRSWLMYSPSKKVAYCICCLLYCRSDHQSSLQQEAGFSQWKAPERMIVHENAKHHRECVKKWKELKRNLSNKTGIIDAKFHVQIEKEKQK